MGATRSVAIEGALSRHQRERERGGLALSVLPLAPADAVAVVGGWALGQGASLALVDEANLDDALAAIVDAIPPWRLLSAARQRLASAAGRHLDEIDAALAARSDRERTAWIADIAAGHREFAVAGALLSSFAGRGAIEPATLGAIADVAPVLAELGGRIAVLVVPREPTVPAIAVATGVAAALCAALPRQPIALAAPVELLDRWLDTAGSTAAASLVRQGRIVRAPEAAPIATRPRRATIKGDRSLQMPRRRGALVASAHREKPAEPAVVRARGSRKIPAVAPEAALWPERRDAGRRLREALEGDPRTSGHFELGSGALVIEGAPAEVDLYDADLAIAVEIEGWRHVSDLDRYRRDRQRDHALQRSHIVVIHVLEPDIDTRLAYLVDQIAEAVAFRRAVGARPAARGRHEHVE